MPLFLEKQEDTFRIEIWKMEEDLEEILAKSALNPSDLKKLESFQSVHRKKEWLCVRMMLQRSQHRFLSNGEKGNQANIIYDEHGKPHIENSQIKISISHTKDYVGLIISEKHHVGIDLERIQPRIEKITHKFLSRDETERIPAENQLHYYYIVWGAKEVLYKIYGRGELLFAEHILTDAFEVKEKGVINASINLPQKAEQKFKLQYEFIGDLLLTYSIVDN